MGVHSLIWLSVLKAYGSFKCVCKIELYVMSDLSDKSEQKYSQRIFMSDQSVFAAQFALNAQLPVKSDNSFFKNRKVTQNAQRKCCALAMLRYPSWDCSHMIGWKLRRHLIGYREFLGEKNAFVNPAVSGESQKSTYKYRPVHTQMQTSSQMKSVL